MTLTACSSEGKAFYVNRDVLMISKYLSAVLSSKFPTVVDVAGGFKEGDARVVSLNIKTEILEVCLKYLHYKVSRAGLNPCS